MATPTREKLTPAKRTQTMEMKHLATQTMAIPARVRPAQEKAERLHRLTPETAKPLPAAMITARERTPQPHRKSRQITISIQIRTKHR
jgi:hypothetical protein